MIITIASQKGGVGKSTIAINLALSLAGYTKTDVALVDTDEQRSCIETLQPYSDRERLTLYEVTQAPHKLLQEIKGKHHVIITDTPPHSHEVMYQAAAVSDLVILPVQPSPLDIRGVAKTVKAMQAIKAKYNSDLVCRFLINRITPRTIFANEVRDTLERLYPFEVLETMWHNREVFKQCIYAGKSAIEFGAKTPAAYETATLCKELNSIIPFKNTKKQ